MKRVLIAIAAISLIVLNSAFSAEKPKSFEITGFVGGYAEGEDDLKESYTIGGQFGYNFTEALALEARVLFIPTELKEGSKDDLDILIYTADFLLNFGGERCLPYFAIGIGGSQLDEDGHKEQDLALGFGLGAKYFFLDSLAFRVDVREHMLVDDFFLNLTYTGGLTYRFGGEEKAPPPPPPTPEFDSDGDTVLDRADQCPDTPRGANVNSIGCPKDSDGDKVLDGLDKCPGTPLGAKVNSSGCEGDSDGDTVLDGIDDCPGTPKGVAVDLKGCPSDTDGDTVVNSLDKCPNTPEGSDVDDRGCIIEKVEVGDRDGDTVTDDIDKCPRTRPGARIDANGCEIIEKQGWELQGIRFRTGSSRIEKSTYPALDDVTDILKANPDLKVEIQGYSDSTGSLKANLRLSNNRARSVYLYLVKNGIDKSRLSFKGYGPENPKASNDTADGRSQNRRIEFKVVE